MHSSFPYIFFVTSVYICTNVLAFSRLAPARACRSMVPEHRRVAQTAAAPYTITVNVPSGNYRPNQLVNVTISANEGVVFKGFLLQAKESGSNGRMIGAFQQPPRQSSIQIACENRAMTHLYARQRTNITGTWKAPHTSMGPVVFQATIVQSFDKFWVGVTSEPLPSMT